MKDSTGAGDAGSTTAKAKAQAKTKTKTKTKTAESEYPPKLSLAEHIKLYSTATAIASTTLVTHGLGGLFRGASGARSLRVHLVHAMIRRLSDTLTDREYQSLLKPTPDAYVDWCKSKKHVPDIVDLPQYGGKGLWVGDKSKATHVMVYYHGGGFALSANEVYFEFCQYLIRCLEEMSGANLAVFFVAYSLTPYARYPTQLQQCVEALEYILTTTSIPSENVYIGGDSAGGNVAIAVLLHFSHHPHPSLAKDVDNDGRSLIDSDSYLGGVFCISPWIDFQFDRPSERDNRNRDCISKKSELAWAKSYADNGPFDAWSEPTLAPAEWFKGARTREFLVLAGSDEILLTGIEEFVEKVQPIFPRLVFFVGQNEGHVCSILDRPLFSKKKGDNLQTWRELLTWFAGCLSPPSPPPSQAP